MAYTEDVRSAEFLCWGTRTLKKVPPLDWLLVGSNNVPDGWQLIHDVVSDLDSMVCFEGDHRLINRLPIPRLYRYAGIMGVHRAAMERLQQEHKAGRLAVGVGIGMAVVVGALAETQAFTPHDKDKEFC
jgi:hypothetical protein